MYLELAKVIPGFAGFAFEGGETVRLQLVDTSLATLASRHVLEKLSAEGRAVRRARVERVRYSFPELYRWKDALRRSAVQGVTAVGISIRRNRVVVGAEAPTQLESVKAVLRHLGVPSDAVDVGVVPQMERRRMDAQVVGEGSTSLQAKQRPVHGGYQILWSSDGQQVYCSVGLNVRWGGETALHMVTAAHCGHRFVMEGTNFFQPLWSSSGDHNMVAYEHHDSPWMPGGTGACASHPYAVCRYSDAVVARYYDDSYGQLGFIGKPQLYNGSMGQDLVAVNQTTPRISIAGSYPRVYPGDEVHHVGRTSGWHSGAASDTTCIDMAVEPPPGVAEAWILCQAQVNGLSGHGDSGGPAFLYNSFSN